MSYQYLKSVPIVSRWKNEVNMRAKALQPLLSYLKASPPLGRVGRLPPERDLAAAIGVSRQALRRALRLLEEAGRIERRVGSGTFLVPNAADAESKATTNAAVDLDLGVPTNPVEVMEVRLMIEPHAAHAAALRGSKADFALMEQCLDKMRSAENWRTYDEWDGALHRAICAATRNRLLLMLFDGFNEARAQVTWGELRLRALKDGWIERYHDQHIEIVEAISQRAASSAAQKMRNHIETVRQDLFRGLDY